MRIHDLFRGSLGFTILIWGANALAMSNSEDASDTKSQQKNSAEVIKVQPADASKAVSVTANDFMCLEQMTPVRGFFVDNLLGDIDATLAAAKNKNGAKYPPGSVVQLVPEEVMVKHHSGWNPITNDWEFFELNVSDTGSKIKVRGTTNVINKFGGNCFSCHRKAAPKWDLICEKAHGCEPLPIPDFLIRMTQSSDERCQYEAQDE